MATRERRDYYAVLGVPREADRETIRRAFRALAAAYHPDVSDDPQALARFREIVEAYDVLSRDGARERYDRYGFESRGLGGFESGFRSARDLFDDLIAREAARAAESRRGADVEVELGVSHAEASKGARKGIHYLASVECGDCGQGRSQSEDAGACPACGGTGSRVAERAALVVVPRDAVDGMRLRIDGAGEAGQNGGEPGDLVVTVRLPRPSERPRVLVAPAVGAVVAAVLLVVLVLVYLLG